MSQIVNKVANSKLISINLEDYYSQGTRVQLDISPWLYEGLILKEADFRVAVENYNWEKYKDSFVALHCATDAIIPGWAYMLVITKLQPYAIKTIQGNLEALETILYTTIINDLDCTRYQDSYIIIKGCSNKPVPPNAYLFLTEKLMKYAKSIMYGEACSSVPLYKRN